MSKYSSIDELYLAHTAEYERRRERYMQNIRAVCRRSGGYDRYKRDSRKYFKRLSRMWYRTTGRVLRHINNDLWSDGMVYTVINGKIVNIRVGGTGE